MRQIASSDPIPLYTLHPQILPTIVHQQVPVRRLRQSREVKFERISIRNEDLGRHTEYLAEFCDGTTRWIPEVNVATNLKEIFCRVMSSYCREVAEIVRSTPDSVAVKRTDGTVDNVSRDRIFWQEEAFNPSKLTDGELEAILLHSHYGCDGYTELQCTVTVYTDWAKVELCTPRAHIKQIEGEIYPECVFNGTTSLQIGQEVQCGREWQEPKRVK